MTEYEIREIIRDEIKQLLNNLLNNAWTKKELNDEGCYVQIANSVGSCVRQTLEDY